MSMVRATAIAAMVAVLVPACGPARDQNDISIVDVPQPGEEAPAEEQRFVHPTLGFSFIPPQRARLVESPPGSQGPDAIVQSDLGYVATIQAGEPDPGQSLEAMVAQLEARYLGANKRWVRKLAERRTMIAGRPALDAVYEGSGTRTRVVTWRGPVRDYVFMYFAPPGRFEPLMDEFEEIVASFRVAAVEQTADITSVASEPQAPAGMVAETVGDLGFAVNRPADWVVSRPGAYTVVFSGAEGSDAFFSTVTVQNVRPTVATGPAEAVEVVSAALKNQLGGSAANVDIVHDGGYSHDAGGQTLDGRVFVAAFDHQGEAFRQLTVVLPRPGEVLAHVLSYTAPADRFDTYKSVAEEIIKSWRPIPRAQS